MANGCPQTLTTSWHVKGVTAGDRTMIYMASKNRLNDEENIYGDMEKRRNGRYSQEKFWKDLLSLFINIWPNSPLAQQPFGQLVFRFCLPHKRKKQILKGSTGVGWSPSPRGGTMLVRGGGSSSSSSRRWRPQPMIPGYLLDRRVGNKGRKREGIHTWKTRVPLSVSKTQVFKKRKGTVNIHSLERNS